MTWTNLIIGYLNYGQQSTTTLTASEADTNFPIANTQLDVRAAVWKSTAGGSAQTVDFDLGSARLVDMISVFDLNDADGTNGIIFRGGNASPPSTVVVQSLRNRLTPAASTSHILQRSNSLVLVPGGGSLTYRYWQLQPSSSPVVESVHVWGKIFIGRAALMTKNYVYGIKYNQVDQTTIARTHAGAGLISRKPSYMTCSFFRPKLSYAEDTEVQTIIDYVGTHTPFPIIFDLDNNYGRRTYWGRFTRVPDLTHSSGSLFDRSFDFEEII